MLSNSEILDNLERHRFKTEHGWTVNVDTKVFYLIINNILNEDHICSEVEISLFERGEVTKEEWADLSKVSDINNLIKEYGIEIDFKIDVEFKIFPHKPIYPRSDTRFKDQPWASKINRLQALGTSGIVSLDEACDIIRYCIKLPQLKVFL